MSIPDLLSLDYLTPFVANKIDFSRAIRGLRGMPRRLLLVGHKVTAGSAAVTTLLRDVGTDADAVGYFGEGSMMVAMWRAASKRSGLGLPIDAIVVPTAVGAAAATTSLVFSTAGATLGTFGDVMLYIGGVRVSVGVQQDATGASIVAALIAAINAVPSLPVSAAVGGTTATLTLTCRWPGISGNAIDVRSAYFPDDAVPTGLTIVIPPMSGGAGTPDVTATLAALAGYRATEYAWAFTDSNNMVLLETELANRWAENNMQDGQACIAVRFADQAAASAYLANRDSEQVHTIPTKADATSPWVTAAMVAASIESQAAVDPAVPHMGINLPEYRGPVLGQGWLNQQPNTLLRAGASPLVIHDDYTAELSRMVTNYTHTGNGAPDRSKSSLNAIKTMSYKRWFNVVTFKTDYPNFKIAEYVTDPIPGQEIMTAELGEEIMIGIYQKFMNVGLMQNMAFYKERLICEVDGPNGKLKIQDEPMLVGQHYQTEITTFPNLGHA